MHRKIVSPVLIVFIAAVSLIMLQPNRWVASASADEVKAGNISKPLSPLASSNALTVGLASDPIGLDPALLTDGNSFQVTGQIYDTLFRYIGSDTNPVPALVESWTASADGKTWTFNLRPGLKFHDGTDLDAAAVVYNFNRWWDPTHPAHNGSFDYFTAFFGGYKDDPHTTLVSVDAIGSLQVQLILKSANNTLPSLLTNPALAIASPTAIQAGTLNTHPVGSGPFKFVEWISGDHIALTANLTYWDDRPQLDALLFKVITDDAARFAALQSNSIQVIHDLARSDLATASTDLNLRVLWRAPSNTGYLGINQAHGLLDAHGVRAAIAIALNKQVLISNTYQTGDRAADQLLPPAIWGRDPNLFDYAYDPNQARQILADAGYPHGFTTTLAYRNVARNYLPNPADSANAIAADLQAIGITVTVIETDSSIFINKWVKGEWDLFLIGWGADHLHPDNFFTPILCDDNNVGLGPKDTELCNQMQAAQSLPDIADQLPIYQWAAQRVHDQLPLIPLAYGGTPLAVRKNVVMLQPSPQGFDSFQDVSLAAPDLVEVSNGEPGSLDPALDFETAGEHINQQIYESLITYNREKTTEFIPLLATAWTISPDGQTYTFTIRPGVTFHNGATLSAEDVAFSFWRGILIGDPNTPQGITDNALFGHPDVTDLIDPNGSLEGNRSGLQNRSALELQTACQTVKNAITYNNSNGTVTFHLAHPWNEFMYTLAAPWSAVLDKDWLIAHGGWTGSCDTWQNFYAMSATDSPLAGITNGTGPYQLDYWTHSVEVSLARNTNYWRQIPMWPGGPTGLASLKRIAYQIVADESQRVNLLLNGQADLGPFAASTAVSLTGSVLMNYDGPDGRVGTLQYPTGTLNIYRNVLAPAGYDAFFNYNIDTNGPRNYIGSGTLDGNGIPTYFFSDIHVRKAFSYAFDWTQFITNAYSGQALQRTGPIIKGILGYTDTQPTYFYSPTKALQEFAQAWSGQVIQHGFVITVAYNTGNVIRQNFAQMLKANLEALTNTFHVNVISLAYSTDYQPDFNNSRLPIFAAGWQQDTPHPNNWVVPWFRTVYADRQRLPNDQRAIFGVKIDACIALSASPAQTCYEDIQNTAYLSATDIFLAQSFAPLFTRAEVRGFYINNGVPGTYYYALSKGALPNIETVTPIAASSIGFSSTLGTTATLDLPAGSITQTLDIVILPDVATQDSPGGFQLGNLSFNLQAYVSNTLVQTQTFQNPITITLHYNAQTLGLLAEDQLKLLWWNGSDWIDAACGAYVRDLANDTLSIPICHFSQFALGGIIKIGLIASGPTVSDTGSGDWLAYQGLLRAQSQFSLTTKVYTSANSSNYDSNFTLCQNEGNALCIGLGFGMGTPASNAAQTYTTTKFAVVDTDYAVAPDNLRGMTFDYKQAGYMAGTLAGLMTTNKVVGVVGGIAIDPVVNLAEGYRNGAQCVNGAARTLLQYTNSFVNPGLGAQIARQMMTSKADVIFGAGGSTGNGAILTTTQSGKWAIGVDTDQYVTLFGNGSVSGANKLLSSAVKQYDNAVFDTIADVISGTFTSGTKMYDLSNDGVGLAPFHGADGSVSSSVRNTLNNVKHSIINGTIDISADCRYYIYLPIVKKNS